MADKVDYNKISIDFSDIMLKLHNIAKSNAGNGQIDLENSAFDEDGKFNGAGEFALFVRPHGGGVIEKTEKGKYLDFIKTYIKYFVGEDASKQIRQEDLQPMTDLSKPSGDSQQNHPSQEQPLQNNTQQTSESMFITRFDRILNESLMFIFEDQPENTSSDETSATDTEKDSEKDDERNLVGFWMAYAIDVAGSQRRSLKDSFMKKTKGLFGGVMADLRNMEITSSNGTSMKIGQLFDPAKWKEAVGIVDINIDTVTSNIKKIILDEFPQANPAVEVYDYKSLYNHLNYNRQLDADIISKIKSASYSVVISISKDDSSYDEFSKEKIADICTKAFGTDANISNQNKVTASDVIQIDNWRSEYKVKTKSQISIDKKNSTANSQQPSKTTKESYENGFDDIIVEGVLNYLFESHMTYNILNRNVFQPYIQKYNSSKFIWKKELIDAKIKELYQKNNPQSAEMENKIKADFQEMYKYQDINDILNNPPLKNYQNISKDSPDGKVINGIAQCFELMFKNTTPPENSENSETPEEQNPENSQDETGQEEQTGDEETSDDNGNNSNDVRKAFIVPHPRLTSQTRPNQEDYYGDGTVKAKTSDREYKSTD